MSDRSRPTAAFTMFVTEDSVQPAELARLVEERGGAALLFPDHTHVPLAAPVGYPGRIDELPPEYARMYDPLIASTVAAAATATLRVGTAICLVNQRDPIALAKELATLDQLSGGRVTFGVGAGWNAAEMANHGFDPARRFRSLRERVAAITEIWSHDEASYEGTTLRFGPLQSWPKPRQRPRPPVLLGGNGPRAPQRALAWADGWLPHTEVGGDEPLLARLRTVRQQAPPGFELMLAMSPSDPARLEAFAGAGVDRFLFQLPTAPRDAAERRIDRALRALASLG
jgi:probable F420-dependent oxidoreductase